MSDTLKGMLQSKTMWLSGFTTLLGVFGWVQDHSAVILALAPQFGPVLTILGVAVGVLRVLTETTPAWKAPVETAVPTSVINLQ